MVLCSTVDCFMSMVRGPYQTAWRRKYDWHNDPPRVGTNFPTHTWYLNFAFYPLPVGAGGRPACCTPPPAKSWVTRCKGEMVWRHNLGTVCEGWRVGDCLFEGGIAMQWWNKNSWASQNVGEGGGGGAWMWKETPVGIYHDIDENQIRWRRSMVLIHMGRTTRLLIRGWMWQI